MLDIAGKEKAELTKSRLRVFLSYSRKDITFVAQLAEALTARGYLADFDQSTHQFETGDTGIAATDDWWVRLQDMIAAADVMVLSVSPDSASSKVVDEEIAYARSLSKRVVAITCREIDFSTAPPRLSSLNVAHWFLHKDFEQALNDLCIALDRDVDWLRKGSRYTVQAKEWADQNGASDKLLFGNEIGEAENWSSRRPANAPEISELVLNFLSASRNYETARLEKERRGVRRTRGLQRVIGLVTLAAALFVAMGAYAVFQIASQTGNRTANMLAESASRANADFHNARAARLALAGLNGSDAPFIGFSADAAEFELRRAMMSSHWIGTIETGLSIHSLAYDHTGARVAAAHDGGASVWDTATRKQLVSLKADQRDYFESVSFSTDDRRLVGSARDKIIVWDLQSRQEIRTLLALKDQRSRLFLPDISADATRYFDFDPNDAAKTAIRDVATGEMLVVVDVPADDHVIDGEISPDGKLLVTGSGDGSVWLWSAATGKLLAQMSGPRKSNYVYSDTDPRPAYEDWNFDIQFSRSGEYVAVGDAVEVSFWAIHTTLKPDWTGPNLKPNATVKRSYNTFYALSPSGLDAIVDVLGSGPSIVNLTGATRPMEITRIPRQATFSSDWGSRLIALVDGSGQNAHVKILERDSGNEIIKLRNARSEILAAAFSPDQRHIVTATFSGSIQLWSTTDSLREVASVEDMRPFFATFDFNADRSVFSVPVRPDYAFLFDARTGERIDALEAAATPEREEFERAYEYFQSDPFRLRLTGTAFSPDGSRVALLTPGTSATVRSDSTTYILKGHNDSIFVPVFSPDGRQILTASMDGTARVWDAASGKELKVLGSVIDPSANADQNRPERIVSAIFSPDGKRVLTGSCSGAAAWDTKTWSQTAVIKVDKNCFTRLEFSPDPMYLAAQFYNTLHIYREAEGAFSPIELEGMPPSGVADFAFSPDSQHLIGALGSDGALIWDLASGKVVRKLVTGDEALSVDYSLDGAYIAIGIDKQISIWSSDTGAMRASRAVQGPVFKVGFSGDGEHIVFALEDRSVWKWDISGARLNKAALMEQACAGLISDEESTLTRDELSQAPALDAKLDANVCKPTSPWAKLAFAVGFPKSAPEPTPTSPP